MIDHPHLEDTEPPIAPEGWIIRDGDFCAFRLLRHFEGEQYSVGCNVQLHH